VANIVRHTDGMLWDVGVVVKDAVVFDEFHEVVENRR
jgi:hypothetical protein